MRQLWYTNIEWIGVSAAPTAYFIIEKLMEVGQDKDVKQLFVNYQIPTKNSFQEKGWVLNWLTYSRHPSKRPGQHNY